MRRSPRHRWPTEPRPDRTFPLPRPSLSARPGLDPEPPAPTGLPVKTEVPGQARDGGFAAPSEQPVPAVILLGDLVRADDGAGADQRAAGGDEKQGDQGRKGRCRSGLHGLSPFRTARLGWPVLRMAPVPDGRSPGPHPVGTRRVTCPPVPRRFPR